ncbi:hypothetical protein ACHAXT_013197 [Thalassiosira profunda]
MEDRRRPRQLLGRLLPPLLLATGLGLFAQSFFLSRTPFVDRSSCAVGAAGELLQRSLGLGAEEVAFLRDRGFLSNGDAQDASGGKNGGSGCWTPRRADAAAIVVVDALRFDFARDHLPLSVGARLFNHTVHPGASKLYQFVADPPTVTMQRLKGLTTGGLPTFADITGSFGGASVEEDSWVEQLKDAPWNRRRADGRDAKPKMAFVGDDTWADLFPAQFDDCHPYPSFNTRDLDTVDDGCLEHLPRLLDGLVGPRDGYDRLEGGTARNATSFELLVAHFLGVDHVGHTYGPNDPHMERKLHQMDAMLSHTLGVIDDAPRDSCVVAFVLGDHGMTEDGNHGGGTSEEVNAGLFVHFSPGCHADGEAITGEEIGEHSARAFDSIHQIDLVPTISLLLGLPIPYANIGGLVPDLLPAPRGDDKLQPAPVTPHAAIALALNAAQVWKYLDTYSRQSRDLPRDKLRELKELLDGATIVLREAIALSRAESREGGGGDATQASFDSSAWRQACTLYKVFLAESTGLGKQVWTQFNEGGMRLGIALLVVALLAAAPFWKRSVRRELGGIVPLPLRPRAASANGGIKENVKGSEDGPDPSMQPFHCLEVATALAFMIFQCGVLTFSNSYIEHEREIVTFFLSALCLLVFRRWYFASTILSSSAYLPLIVALCARANDIFITGHGLDPSIRLHPAHHSVVFLSSLGGLAMLRRRWLESTPKKADRATLSTAIDVLALLCMAGSWWEKRSLDHSRTGFSMARASIALVLVGLALTLHELVWPRNAAQPRGSRGGNAWSLQKGQIGLFRVLLFLVIVTGPSAASTAAMTVIQCAALRLMMESTGARKVASPVMAAVWRLAMRHSFFATNHHCSFNRLQYSAAFVATNTFHFHLAGSSLFMNTFGWEILGSSLVLVYSRAGRSKMGHARGNVWSWFVFFQALEMVASCVSVSAMKRHLMVWAIFAPRFMFSAVFTAVNLLLWIFDVLVMGLGSQGSRSPDPAAKRG